MPELAPLECGIVNRRITSTSTSPTPFRRARGTLLPSPLSEMILDSPIECRSQYAPLLLDPGLRQFIAERVVLSRHRNQTRCISFERAGRRAITGSMGRATFAVQSAEPYGLQQMAMVAVFARYSGSGVQTTIGLGQA